MQQYDENHCDYFARIGRHSEKAGDYGMQCKEYFF